MALKRLQGFETYIVTNSSIAEEIKVTFTRKGLKSPLFLIEPEARDTAAAVGFGLKSLKEKNPDFVAVLSADHWMPDDQNFQKFLTSALEEVEKFSDSLFVAGSPASTKSENSHSSFGWILPRELSPQGRWSLEVKKFVEKPQGSVLEDLRSKNALINAGMFFGKWKTFCSAYERFYPNVLDTHFEYSNLERQPIDRAIFERYEKIRVLPFDMEWQDLGTWMDWYKNIGDGNGIRKKTKDVFISSELEVHAYGVSNLAIVQRGSKLLIMPLSETVKLKEFLES